MAARLDSNSQKGTVLNDFVKKQAKIARRRLTVERFLGYLPWTICVALLVTLAAMALPKWMHLPVDMHLWVVCWLAGSLLVAFIANFCLTLLGRASLSESAMEIDRRFGLKERLASALALTPEDQETDLGQALVEDANQRAEKLDVRDKFDWGFTRKLLIPLLPALAMVAVWYIPNRPAPERLSQSEAAELNPVESSTQELMKQIKQKRESAEKRGLSAAEVDLFKKLESELAKLQKDAKLDTKQTLTKLNDIKDQLDRRRKELGGADALRKNLKNLEKFEAGPAEKLADALKQGDFEKAEESLRELLKKMQNGEMSQQDMQQLEKQLKKLEQALAQAAQAHEQAKQALKQQIAQAEAAGDLQKAAQLQRKLQQMQGMDANMQQMQQMADMLAKAQQSMQQGDMQSAQQTMQQMASQLQQMNQADRQLQDLDELMDSLAQSKSQMMCKQCNGAGCTSCMMGSMMGQIPGQGMGEGQGRGDRPEEENDVDFVDSQVKDRMRRGETIYGGKVGGENRKGTTRVEVQDAVLTSLSEEPEPLDDTPLPKLQRDHTRAYFNAIREGN